MIPANDRKETTPTKVYVELTTRCNLSCRKCVKQTEGSAIGDRDMPMATFEKLLPSLPPVETLVLNGIGEPLLYPHIESVLHLARGAMAEAASIGFQSNGLLLDDRRARNLLAAGLDTICLSLDEPPATVAAPAGEHSPSAVTTALANLERARTESNRNFRIGLEVVLKAATVHRLPELVTWAAKRGVDYIITTHLIAYDSEGEKQTLFNPNSHSAVVLYEKYRQLALEKGLSFDEEFARYRKYAGTRSTPAVRQLFAALEKEAKDQDIYLNIESLLRYDACSAEMTQDVLQQAAEQAAETGVQLLLPPLQADEERACPFVDADAAFIDVSGRVMPCHFLWHTYRCKILREEIQVNARDFGTVMGNSLASIWQREPYKAFRAEAGRSEYSRCWSCSMAPCSNLVNDNIFAAYDCFGSGVPCGHCHWSLGGFHCL